jgi:hypothetical protein
MGCQATMNRLTAITVLTLFGCGGQADQPPAQGNSSSTYTVSVTVEDLTTSGPLTGATGCVLGSSASCATADATGAFSLQDVAAQGSGFVVSLSGYVTENFPIYLDSTATYGVTISQSTLLTTDAQDVGASFDTSTGAIFFAVEDGSGNQLTGATVSTSPAGTTVYRDSSGQPNPSFVATAGHGGLVFGIQPGTANVTITASAACRRAAGIGWPPTMTGAVMAVPIVAHELTRVHGACF